MRRILLSFFALLIILAGTFITYQHWQVASETSFQNNIVQLNSSLKINNISVDNDKTLVPLNAIKGINDVDHVDFQYLVNVDDSQAISVSLSNITVHNEAGTYHLDYLLSSSYETSDMGQNYKLVSIRVYMNEPKTYEDYQLISDSSVSFDIDFDLS